jgi:hypothetical protein
LNTCFSHIPHEHYWSWHGAAEPPTHEDQHIFFQLLIHIQGEQNPPWIDHFMHNETTQIGDYI